MWLVVLGGLVLLALYKLLYNSNVNSEDTDKSENSIPDLSQNLESIPESPDLTRARSFISGIIASKMKQESAYTPEILDVSQIEQDIVCDKPEISCKVQEISSSEPIVSKIAETVVPKSEISDDIACKVHEVIASEKIVSKIAETVVPKSEISDDIACNVQEFISNQPIVSKIAKTVESVMPKSEISEEVQYIIDPVVSKTTEMVESPQSEFFENFACKVTRPIESTVVAIAENVQSASPKSEISDDNICKIQESITTEPIIAKVAETLESFETEYSDNDVDTTEDIIFTETVESVIPTEISPNKISSVHFSEPLVTKTTEILVSLSPETEISDDFTSEVTSSTEPETFISVTKEMISDKIQEIIIDEPIITETVNILSQEISNATNVQSSDPTIPESESLIFNESNVPRDTPTNDVIAHEITAKSETKNDIEPEVGQTIICTSQTVHESPAADTEIISPEITVHATDLKNDIAAEIEQVIISDSPKNLDKTEETISTEIALEEAIVCESPKIQDKIEETFSMELTVPVNDAEIEKEISLEPPKIQDKVEETISMEKTVTGEQAIVCESPKIREKIEETIFTEMTVPKNDTEAKVKQAVNLESPKIEEMIFTEMTVPKKFTEAKVEQAVNLESPKIQDKIEEAIFTDTTVPLTPKIEDKVEEDIFTEITVPTTPKIDDKCDITNQAEIKKVISTAHDLSESSDDSISMEVTVPKSTEDKIAITLESECKEEIFDLNQFERQISTASSVPQIPEPSKDIQTTDLDEPISEEQTICNVEPGKESSFVNCSESLSEIENTLKRLESCITHNIEEIVEVEHKPSPKIVKIVPAEVPEVDNDSLMEEFESNDAEIDIPAPQIHPSDMLPKSPEIAEILAALDDPPETLIIEDIQKTSPETTTEVPEPTMKSDSSHSETEVPKHTKIVVNKQFENECKIPEPSSSIPEPTKLFETFVDNQRTVTECTIPETDINCNPETESRTADPETFSKTSAQATEKAAKQLDELLEELNLAPHIVTKGNTDAASLNELATGDEIIRGTLEIVKNGVKTSLESVPSTSETLDEITLILVPETSEIEQDESSTEESVHCDTRDVPLSPNEEISVVEIVEKFNIPVVAVKSNKKSLEISVESSENPTEVAHSVESHEISDESNEKSPEIADSVESNEKSSEILVGGNSKSLEISVESNEKAPKVEKSKVEVPVDSLESSIRSQAALLKAIDLEDTRTKTDENRTISSKNENGINVTEVANEVNSIIDEAAARVEANANIMGQIKPEVCFFDLPSQDVLTKKY